MENEDVILNQMEDTRTSLTEKLETLEKSVASTVQGASSNVAQTVEAVKDTVEAVKDTVQDTVATVKSSVDDTIDAVKCTVEEGVTAVKDFLDIPAHVRAHPWLMFGGSIAAGFFLETLVARPAARRRPLATHGTPPLPPDHVSGEARIAPHEATSMLSGLIQKFQPEIQRLKGVALGAFLSAIRDSVLKSVPPHMASSLEEIFENVSKKLGGELPRPEREQPNGRHRSREEAFS